MCNQFAAFVASPQVRVQAGVAVTIAADDAATHMDLAQAYLEMGLHHDAVREAAIAVRAAARPETTLSALRLLLTPPLLDTHGLDRLRGRLAPRSG